MPDMHLSSMVPASASALGVAGATADRSEPATRARVLRFGPLTLDPEQGRAAVNGEAVALSAAECLLLRLLISRRGVVMSKAAILGELFGGEGAREPRIVDVLVCRLRGKLAKAGLPEAIATVWGRGYTLAGPDRSRAAPQPQLASPCGRRARPMVAVP